MSTDLFGKVTFHAILSGAEQRMLDQLPDWPTQQKLTDRQRALVSRLKRLGCIEIARSKADPIQFFFDIYGGVTPLGRASAERGIVDLA